MTLLSRTIHAFEATPLPDPLRHGAVSWLVGNTSRRLRAINGDATPRFARDMANYPIAACTEDANTQHYEVPAAFFLACLGPNLKYSCCRYDSGRETLREAEEKALAETCANAQLVDGQDILELGCGWGSLTLWMARAFPNARITAVSNSNSQRAHIEARAQAEGLTNVNVITADMNVFDTVERFDRIVSIEMFEHMSNWRALLERCRTWLRSDGLMLVHVFAHKNAPYRFDIGNQDDWIAQHFFAGGVMPSRDLMANFPDLFSVEREWWWNGRNYQRTALHWLANFDARVREIRPILAATYGAKARVWEHRWRLFFIATAGLFGHANGEEWGVAHYLLRPTA